MIDVLAFLSLAQSMSAGLLQEGHHLLSLTPLFPVAHCPCVKLAVPVSKF